MTMQERCRETAGFLFSHPCKNPATARCSQCGKPVCAEHGRAPAAEAGPEPPGGWPQALLCVGCTRRQAAADPQALARRQDDPLFYAWALYPDYQAYSSSYTDADRAAFAAEEVPATQAEWERDWDVS